MNKGKPFLFMSGTQTVHLFDHVMSSHLSLPHASCGLHMCVLVKCTRVDAADSLLGTGNGWLLPPLGSQQQTGPHPPRMEKAALGRTGSFQNHLPSQTQQDDPLPGPALATVE